MKGRVASLHVYPVKGCRGLSLPAADVEPWGLAGDRRWLIVDEDGRFVTQRETAVLATITATPVAGGLVFSVEGLPALEVAEPARGPLVTVRVWRDEVAATPADEAAAAWLSKVLGRRVRLVYLSDPRQREVDPKYGSPGDVVSFADSLPLLLTNTSSLDHLNSRLADPLPMNRFRPNLVVFGAGAWAEDGWQRIRVGAVTFRVAKPCGRCIVTTTDQTTGERGPEPLRTLAAYRNLDGRLVFGQNCIPDAPGTIRVGDPVEVL